MPRRKPNPNERPEGMADAPSVMARALARVGMADVAIYLHIQRIFDESVGPQVAKNARPESFSRGKLVLAAASSTWQTELHFLRERIAQSINERLPRPWVKQVRLVARSRRAPAPIPPRPAEPALPTPSYAQRCEADACAQRITDEETRDVFARVMAMGLAHAQMRR